MPDASLALTLLFSALLVLGLLTKFYLASRQIRHVARHRDAVPAAFAATISLASHQKAADYTLAKPPPGRLDMGFAAAVLRGRTLLGGIDTPHRAPGAPPPAAAVPLLGFTFFAALCSRCPLLFINRPPSSPVFPSSLCLSSHLSRLPASSSFSPPRPLRRHASTMLPLAFSLRPRPALPFPRPLCFSSTWASSPARRA